MSGRDDDRGDRDDRHRLSWSEIDKRRDGSGSRDRERRPRGAAAAARSEDATRTYLERLDRQLFSGAKGGAEGEALAQALRDAHGTPELAGACRAYHDAIGVPDDPALLSIMLDAGEKDLVIAALEALAAGLERGALEISRGVQSQLRMLEQDSDDDVAYAAEEVLGRL